MEPKSSATEVKLARSGFDVAAGVVPGCRADWRKDFESHVSVYSDLAAQPEFAEDAVFFEASALGFAHRRLFG